VALLFQLPAKRTRTGCPSYEPTDLTKQILEKEKKYCLQKSGYHLKARKTNAQKKIQPY